MPRNKDESKSPGHVDVLGIGAINSRLAAIKERNKQHESVPIAPPIQPPPANKAPFTVRPPWFDDGAEDDEDDAGGEPLTTCDGLPCAPNGLPIPFAEWTPNWDQSSRSGPNKSGRRKKSNSIPSDLIRMVLVNGILRTDDAGAPFIVYPTDEEITSTYGVSQSWLAAFKRNNNIARERANASLTRNEFISNEMLLNQAETFADHFTHFTDLTGLVLKTIKADIQSGRMRPTPGDAVALMKAHAQLQARLDQIKADQETERQTGDFSLIALAQYHRELVTGSGGDTLPSTATFFAPEDADLADLGVLDEMVVNTPDGWEVAPPMRDGDKLLSDEQDRARREAERERREAEEAAAQEPDDPNTIDPAELFAVPIPDMQTTCIHVDEITSSTRIVGLGYDDRTMTMQVDLIDGSSWRYHVRPVDYATIRDSDNIRRSLDTSLRDGLLRWETMVKPADD